MRRETGPHLATRSPPEDITVGIFDRFRQPEWVQPRSCFPDPACPYADIACSEDWMCAGCAPDLLLGHQARPIELAERAREGTNQDGAR